MRTLILCGGRGTRAYPATAEVLKPLLEVAGRPILAHVMEIYARQGHTDFVLAAGHLGDQLERFAATVRAPQRVDVVHTGADSGTGARVAACADRLGDRFFLTYADGVGNIDLARLLAFHDGHPGAATVTAVPLPSPYGTFELDASGGVRSFREKPVLDDHLINAGFFVMDKRVLDRWAGPDLEREVLPGLSESGELYAYRHRGFWRSMDTHKDALALTTLCEDGRPPWFAASP